MLRGKLETSRIAPESIVGFGIWSAGLVGAYMLAISLCDTSLLRVLSLVGTGIALAAIFRAEFLIILLMVSSLVTRGPINIAGDITPFDIIILLLAIHVVVQIVRRRKDLALSREAKVMLVLLFFICFSELLGYLYFPRRLFFEVSFKSFIQLIEFQVIPFAMVLCLKGRKGILRIVKWQIICAAVLALATIYESQRGVIFINDQSLFGNAQNILRGELKSNPNSLLLIIPAIAFLVYSKRYGLPRLAVLAFILYPFIPLGTRTFYLALCGSVLAMFLLRKTHKSLGIALTVAIAILINSELVLPKVEEISKGVQGYFLHPYSAEESSTFGRLVLWKTAPRLLMKHPLWGYGVNGYGMEIFLDPTILLNERIMIAGWAKGDFNPAGKTHNQYLQTLFDHGAIAFALAAYLLARTLKRCFARANSQDEEMAGVYRALFVSIIGFLFGFMSVSLLTYHGNNFLQMFFWLNIGLAYAPADASSDHALDPHQEIEGDELTIEGQCSAENG